MCTDLVLDALEQALWSRTWTGGMVHHSDRGAHYLSIHYTEHFAGAGVESSVRSVGDLYDSAQVETIISLFKTGDIRRWGGLAQHRWGRVRYSEMGGLVQSPPAAGADLRRPAGKERTGLLSVTVRVGRRSLTQTEEFSK